MYTFRGVRMVHTGNNWSRDTRVPFCLPCRHTWRIQFGLGTPQRVISLIENGKGLESAVGGRMAGTFTTPARGCGFSGL
jgi:hypothetical protein